MGWSRQLGTVSSDEASGVAKRACEGTAKLTERDAATLQKALVMAKAGIEQLGGSADVWIAGGDKVWEDEDKVEWRQVTISATVTIQLPASQAKVP